MANVASLLPLQRHRYSRMGVVVAEEIGILNYRFLGFFKRELSGSKVDAATGFVPMQTRFSVQHFRPTATLVKCSLN